MSHHHGMSHLGGMHSFCHFGHRAQPGDRFGRMFDLPPLYLPVAALQALGAQGGPMDGGTTAQRTQSVTVGHVFFGQFIDHDITLDTTSSLSAVADATTIPNARTPTLDLDCIYGAGPEAHPFLYHASGAFAGVKLLTGADGTAVAQDPALAQDDLARSAQGTAIIGDPRNDENRIVSQLQLAMIRFHNKVADTLHAMPGNTLAGGDLFEAVRRTVTWHYQWVVLQDFLVAMCGAAVVSDILGNGRRYYCAAQGDPFIPIEFAAAAYRFGHSMIPQKIQIQKGKPALEVFGPVLGEGFAPLSDARAVVDWNELVTAAPGHNVQKAEKLDSKLATDLLALPFIPAGDVQSLAARNLLRGQTFLLPSGENVALALGRAQAEIDKVSQAAAGIAGTAADLASGTPLWFYLLVEAEKIGRETTPGHFDKGEGLGPVGARIVAETLIGLLELDPRSFLAGNRNWDPAQGVGVATLGALLTF